MIKRTTTRVPPDAEIFVGLRGGKYYIENNVRYYIRVDNRKPGRKYTPPKGAFKRYLENTMQ